MPTFIQHATVDAAALAAEAADGLLARPAAVAPKFFYDDLGSRLFSAITALPEYYPTRTEAAILAAHAAAMAAAARERCGSAPTMVDLGAGNCEKARSLFATFHPSRYVAVDISADYLRDVLACLHREMPAIDMVGVGADFSSRLELPAHLLSGPSLLFYPGSSIGNFEPAAALRFVRDARRASQGGALLIGVDLIKPVEVLEPAYDDALGVTAAFNLNVLAHLNRLIGSDFDVAHWRHVAFFDRTHSRIEMHLEARRATAVHWPGAQRRFDAGERILTEYSYKWERERFARLLREAGFDSVQTWTDDRNWFAVMLAQ
jgi:L-histidine N-alpha-methyltransferase